MSEKAKGEAYTDEMSCSEEGLARPEGHGRALSTERPKPQTNGGDEVRAAAVA